MARGMSRGPLALLRRRGPASCCFRGDGTSSCRPSWMAASSVSGSQISRCCCAGSLGCSGHTAPLIQCHCPPGWLSGVASMTHRREGWRLRQSSSWWLRAGLLWLSWSSRCSASAVGVWLAHQWRRAGWLCQSCSNCWRLSSITSLASAARRCSTGRPCSHPNQPTKQSSQWRSTVRH